MKSAGSFLPIRLAFGLIALFWRDLNDLGQPDEVVGRHSQDEGGCGSGGALDLEPRDAADRLGPAECPDALADASASVVAGVAGGVAPDQSLADLSQLTVGAADEPEKQQFIVDLLQLRRP